MRRNSALHRTALMSVIATAYLISVAEAQDPVAVTASSCKAFNAYVVNNGLPIAPKEHGTWGITIPAFNKVAPQLTRGFREGWKCVPTGEIVTTSWGDCNAKCPAGLAHVGPVCPPVSSELCTSADMRNASIDAQVSSQMWVWAIPAKIVENNKCWMDIRNHENLTQMGEEDHIADAHEAATYATNLLHDSGPVTECSNSQAEADKLVSTRVDNLMQQAWTEAVEHYNQSVAQLDEPQNGRPPIHGLLPLNCNACPE
jgi:hypothetical protein